MKKIYFCFFSVLLIFTSRSFAQEAQEAQEMTIEQCLEFALGNNESIQISELSIKDAEAEIRGIVALGLPQATLRGGGKLQL